MRPHVSIAPSEPQVLNNSDSDSWHALDTVEPTAAAAPLVHIAHPTVGLAQLAASAPRLSVSQRKWKRPGGHIVYKKPVAAPKRRKTCPSGPPTSLPAPDLPKRPVAAPKRRKKIMVVRKSVVPAFDGRTLPEGWAKETVARKSGGSTGHTDIYYYAPNGKRFRSKVEVRSYLARRR